MVKGGVITGHQRRRLGPREKARGLHGQEAGVNGLDVSTAYPHQAKCQGSCKQCAHRPWKAHQDHEVKPICCPQLS